MCGVTRAVNEVPLHPRVAMQCPANLLTSTSFSVFGLRAFHAYFNGILITTCVEGFFLFPFPSSLPPSLSSCSSSYVTLTQPSSSPFAAIPLSTSDNLTEVRELLKPMDLALFSDSFWCHLPYTHSALERDPVTL